MATTFTTHHGHSAVSRPESNTTSKAENPSRGEAVTFIKDLIEDVRQKPLQSAAFAKHDMFREHINAMAISYFALIILLILASFPMIAYLIN